MMVVEMISDKGLGSSFPDFLSCRAMLSFHWSRFVDTFVSCLLIVRDRTSAIDNQDWHSQVTESGHCLNYRIFKTVTPFEHYLTILKRKEALDLCRFRCGNHKLPITTGRYNQTGKVK